MLRDPQTSKRNSKALVGCRIQVVTTQRLQMKKLKLRMKNNLQIKNDVSLFS